VVEWWSGEVKWWSGGGGEVVKWWSGGVVK
jgi:hypothetical protein